MMKQYRLQFSLAATVLCLLASCSSSKQEGMKDITQLPTYKVEGVKYNQEEIITGKSWEFHRIGENFFVFNGLPNSAAAVVRMSDCKVLGEFMPKGMGPGECNAPCYAGSSAGEDTIYMYDIFQYKLSEFLFPIQKEDTLRYVFSNAIRSSDQELYNNVCRLENGLFVGVRYNGTRHLFTLLDEHLDSICSFGDLPIPEEDDELKNFMPFQGVVSVEKNTFYFACKLLPFMCAYEIRDKNHIDLKFKYNYLPPVYTYKNGNVRIDEDKTIEFVRDLKLNGDYIWAAFHGEIISDVLEDPFEKGACQSILLFDKRGIPLAKFELPIKGSHFCFSKDGQQLFLHTNDCDIYEFQVSDFLKHIE